jgi:DNA-binding GntR family transcriptional regulator
MGGIPNGRREGVAYEALRTDILTRALKPGEPLVERELADRYGISRTPIRTVLHRLAYEYLVELHPGHSAHVRQFTVQDLAAIFEARLAVEPVAAGLAATRHDPDALGALRVRFLRLRLTDTARTLDAHARLGRALHDFVAEAAGNPFLADAYTRLGGVIEQVRGLTRERYEIEERSYRAHLRIIEALRRGRSEESEAAMRDHLTETWRGVVHVLARQM